ncbi:MAG: PTS system mannose/fructose/sorbose family transporter subunit IID [Anaerolineaceae bacterium]|nr:PTS system mannose/fructose/sorbose family transporter subunit IID [Anaerolineaceae bacterium]
MKYNKKQVSIAMVISILLLVASFVIVQAAPETQEESAPKLSFLMAIIIGLMYYASMSPWFANLGFSVLYRPLIAGTLVGLVMGQLAEGIAIGANINVLYLGWISAGGSLPGDPGLAGYLGTALVLGAGLDMEASLAIAAPLGLLGGLTWSFRMSLCSIIPHWADKFAEKGDIKGVARSNYIYSQPFLVLIYGVPVTLAAYLGAPAVAGALNWIGANAIWVMSGMFAASGMLSALGIALNLKFLFTGNVWPYYFIGFTVVSMMGGSVNLLMFAIIGAGLAFMHVLFTSKGEKAEAAPATEAKEEAKPGLLTRQDVFKSFVRWLFFSHSTYNWERMQGLGFAHAMTPIIAKLYKTKEDISAALKRHLIFFNTQPDIGGVVHGIVIAMEEERAMGADISDDAINSVKIGLMGPMAGIGDTIQQGIYIPITLAIGMSVATGGDVGGATRGNILGPLFFFIMMLAFVWGVGWWVYYTGYRQGRSAVTGILKTGALDRLMTGAMVLGNFIIGALTVSFVKVSTNVGLVIGGTQFVLQDVFNQFMPNLLPLLLVLLIWWLLAKKQVSPTVIMVVILVVGILTAYPIWPGINAETGEAIRVGLFGS